MKKAQGALFWIIVVIAIIISLIAQCTGEESVYDDEHGDEMAAIHAVQSAGKKSTIVNAISSDMGAGSDVVGWAAYHDHGDVYDVSFTYRDGRKEIVYEWEADLGDSVITAKNYNADAIMKET